MMIELVSARARRFAASDTRLMALLGATAVGSFGWLLANDLVHPLAVYLLQLYLSF